MQDLSALYESALHRQSKGDTKGAIELYRKILRRKPDSPEVLCNLGGALHATGQLAEAIRVYQKALVARPDLAPLCYNLAGAHQALGQNDQARTNYNRAITLKPDYLEAYFGLGMLDMQTGLYSAALKLFQHVLSVKPDIPEALNAAGICHKSLGDSAQALACFQRVLDLNPNHFEALGNIATELMSRGDFDAAVKANERALALLPAERRVLYNLGVAYKEKKRFEDAADCFRKVLDIDPSATYARLDLGHTLQTVCDWREDDFSLQSTAALITAVLQEDDETDIDLFNALSLPLENDTLLRIAERSSEKIRARSTQSAQPPAFDRYPDQGRLRVGYLSPKYRNHPGAHLMGGLFNAHDRDRFEIFAYSIGPDDGSIYRQRAEADAEHFVDLYDTPIDQCIERIRSDRIHVLVDLAGYTTGARPGILAARAAPVQVNYLGFPGTLGADFIDYIITDTIVTPPAYQAFFKEMFAYLPHCYQINDARNQAAETVAPKSEHGLPEDSFVFCCFNNNYKIDPDIFAAWAGILAQVPGSVLWLLRGSQLQMDNLRREASGHGIDPGRIIFAEPVDKANHLARHCHADLFLDTFYYNAHTTGSDALRQGVPMITCQGGTFAARVGSSLLHAVGLDELVTTDLEGYERKAILLATDRSLMNEIRGRLLANLPRTSLLDNTRFARNLEQLYESMWQRFAKGEKPKQITPNINA